MHSRGFITTLAAVVLSVGRLAAQTPAAPPAFEVATIKTAPPLNPAMAATGKMHVGLKMDAGRLDIGYMSLSDLLCIAYEIKAYQLSGPDWMKTERFDILAKLPEGATREQLPVLMQGLLADRFKVAIHKETKDHAMYALVVGKGGAKLKDAPEEAEPPADAAPPKGGMAIATNNGTVQVNQSGDGRGAVVRVPGGGTTKMTMGQDGNMHMEMSRASMPAFAEILTRFVDRPVMDRTELKGSYQVALDISLADLMQVARASGVAIPPGAMGGGRGGAGGAGGPGAAASDPDGSTSIFNAVQSLGLKLEPRKEPVVTVVVDHIEKTPTEN